MVNNTFLFGITANVFAGVNGCGYGYAHVYLPCVQSQWRSTIDPSTWNKLHFLPQGYEGRSPVGQVNAVL